MVQGAARGYRVQPSGEARFAAKLRQLMPHGDPNVLAYVARIGVIAQNRMHQTKDAFVVQPHQFSESRLIAATRGSDQGCLGGEFG